MTNLEKLIKVYQELGWMIDSDFNLTYLRDANPDTFENTGLKPDAWNCARIIWSPRKGIQLNCYATTRPGRSAVKRRMNPGGTFSIKADHFHSKCWGLGRHITKSSNHFALVQTDTIVGTRDNNENFKVSDDKTFLDAGGVNQHTTGNNASSPAPGNVGGYSYGCLVGKVPSTHFNKFEPLIRASGKTRFDTGVIYSGTFNQIVGS